MKRLLLFCLLAGIFLTGCDSLSSSDEDTNYGRIPVALLNHTGGTLKAVLSNASGWSSETYVPSDSIMIDSVESGAYLLSVYDSSDNKVYQYPEAGMSASGLDTNNYKLVTVDGKEEIHYKISKHVDLGRFYKRVWFDLIGQWSFLKFDAGLIYGEDNEDMDAADFAARTEKYNLVLEEYPTDVPFYETCKLTDPLKALPETLYYYEDEGPHLSVLVGYTDTFATDAALYEHIYDDLTLTREIRSLIRSLSVDDFADEDSLEADYDWDEEEEL